VRAREWLFQIHLWLGLVLGLVVGTVGLTGAIVVFRYELNRMTVPGTAYVEEQSQRLSIDILTARVRADRPEDQIAQVSWEVGPDTAWNYRSLSPEGHRIHTFIDQYTGEIVGQENYQDKTLQWFFDLHAYLLAGDTGKMLNGFVALTTIILSLTGLVIWWPGIARWRAGLTYMWGAGWKRQNYDLHKVVGFYTCLALAFVSLTGAYFSFPTLFQWSAEKLTGTRHSLQSPPAETSWDARHVPMDAFIEAAERAQPGARAISLSFPREEGAPVSVRTREARDWHRIGLNYVYLEPADASLLRSDRFSESTAATRLVRFMYPFHFGRFGGRLGPVSFYAVMVVYVLIGIAPFALMISGFLMYWNRSLSKRVRRHRGARPTGTPAIGSG
jgi:uncharacterized iron-regulated membrane protein